MNFNGITFVRYPYSNKNLYFICKKLDKARDGSLIAHGDYTIKVVDGKEVVVYDKSNKMQFYCKSVELMSLIQGKFNVEKCSSEQQKRLGRHWWEMFGKQKLPRKLKKTIIGSK